MINQKVAFKLIKKISNVMNKKMKSDKSIVSIINSYIDLFNIINKSSKDNLSDSIELNKIIFISRLDSPSYEFKKDDDINIILLNTIKAISESLTLNDKLSIKPCAKLISFIKLDNTEVENMFDNSFDYIIHKRMF